MHKLEQKKQKLKELRHQLRSRKSRVREFEAEKYFLAGDLHEKSIVEKELRDKLAKGEEKVTEAMNNGKRKVWIAQHKTKLAVLVRKAKGFAGREGAQAGTEEAEVEGA